MPVRSPFKSILIANRGEIAVRIARACAELGIESVAVASTDDLASQHSAMADRLVRLGGRGAAAFLDMNAMLQAAADNACDAIHPGYGFLSENADFARRCRERGIAFIGPSAETLLLFGDKSRARQFASERGIAVPEGTSSPTSLEEAHRFMEDLGEGGQMMVKAILGGGGRGMRMVTRLEDLDTAFAQCASEARKAFGSDALYVERRVTKARHIEVQVAGDGRNAVHLGDRDCSLQRRHQKLVEIAPSPWLAPDLRDQLLRAALTLTLDSRYETVGTFEFLVPMEPAAGQPRFVFIEGNPRLQVEHTVTEEVMGIDLVATQIRLAAGETLQDIGLTQSAIVQSPGYSVQFRVVMEALGASADADSAGVLKVFDLPSGPGIRVDTHCHRGDAPSRNFDSLLAKLVVTHRSRKFADALDRSYRALCELRIEGVENNVAFLQNLALNPDFRSGPASTDFFETHRDELAAEREAAHPKRHARNGPDAMTAKAAHGPTADADIQDGLEVVSCDLRGAVGEISVVIGQVVHAGQQVTVLEAMKMEHGVAATVSGTVRQILVNVGDMVLPGSPLVAIYAHDAAGSPSAVEATATTTVLRCDLQEVHARHALTLDAARPEAVARRRATQQRTARENLDDLCDEGSFREYGALAVAAQRSSRPFEELQSISPADGFIYGMASINAHLFGPDHARCMVASHDYTVFSGTQGFIGHRKLDRLFELAQTHCLPLVIFTEGGGGRALDTDNFAGVNLANPTFWKMGQLSGTVPLVGIVSGPCFAASAGMLGCCDVTIATKNASIGMGGPVMIEGAGLGRVKVSEVGPAAMHAKTGVVDVLVEDEAEAVAVAKRYLAYFQGTTAQWTVADQAALREVIPERRTRAYDIREVIRLLADTDSVLELRPQFGCAAVTVLARIEGRPVGVIANDPRHTAGAIGADEADKFTRFMKLCNAFGLPIVSLCDTPGFMVGPDAERTALVRHISRIFVTGPKLEVPFFTIVLRKAYGLGGMAMGGGCFGGSLFAVAWPTGEFGSMGLEGQARLAHRKALEAIEDPLARKAKLNEYVDQLYARNKAINIAPFLSIDDVIDPAQTRGWIVDGLRSAKAPGSWHRHAAAAGTDTW